MAQHLQRMIELADQDFDVRIDPDQLNVTEEYSPDNFVRIICGTNYHELF